MNFFWKSERMLLFGKRSDGTPFHPIPSVEELTKLKPISNYLFYQRY